MFSSILEDSDPDSNYMFFSGAQSNLCNYFTPEEYKLLDLNNLSIVSHNIRRFNKNIDYF